FRIAEADAGARRERAVALTQQNAPARAAIIGYHQVELAVGVEIADGNRFRPDAGGEGLHRLKRAVALAQKHADRATAVVRRDQIELAVAVEVTRRHPIHLVARIHDRTNEARQRSLLQDFKIGPKGHGATRASATVPGSAPARRQSGLEVLQPTEEGHGKFSLFRLVCNRMAVHLPGAQTVRRGGTGPVGACLAVRTPPAALSSEAHLKDAEK